LWVLWRRPKLATDMARAYVDGFQTSQNRLMRMKDGNQSVNAMIKHWPSGGRKKEVVMDILRMVNLQYIREIISKPI
jgi:hypothetical protein